MELSTYSSNHHQFISPLPKLLEAYAGNSKEIKSIIDIGCGDGGVLFPLKQKLPSATFTGVDLSTERLERLKTRDQSVETVVADACNLQPVKNRNFDLVVSCQVIEHVPSDKQMLKELLAITRPGGSLYISSVVKKWYGWWIYKCNGKITCDPTHVREYRSKQEFCKLIEESGFRVIECRMTPFCPSILNFAMRMLVRAKILKYNAVDQALQRHPVLVPFLQKFFRVWAPGFFVIEVVAIRDSSIPTR